MALTVAVSCNRMAWGYGTGVIWTINSGVLSSRAFGQKMDMKSSGELHFVQISDSHMGFNKPANPDVAAPCKASHRQDQCAAAATGVYHSHRGL